MTAPRLSLLLGVLLAGLIPATSAHAAFFGNQVLDGPDAGIESVGDVDVARDGSAAVTYVKQVGGVDHVYVVRLLNGVWQAPEQLDAGLAGPSSQPVVAASDNGRVAVAYISGGTLVTLVKPNAQTPFGAPTALATNASDPSIDMSINGGAYLSFTTGSDVRLARMDRLATALTLMPDVVDINQPNAAGTGTGRSKVAVSADGTAVVVWGEGGQVYGRRVFGDKISTSPQQLSVPNLGDVAAGPADMPSIDIEDDSSYAWAVFRQAFSDGRFHTVARRLVGSLFQNETKVDATPFGAGGNAAGATVSMSGKGEGIAVTSTDDNASQVALLHDDTFFPAVGIGGANGVPPHAVGVFDEVNDGYALWLQGATPAGAQLHATYFDVKPANRGVPAPGPDSLLSQPGIDPDGGLDADINRAGDVTAAYVAIGPNGRTLMAGGFDRPPGTFRTYTTEKYRKFARPPLSWSTSFELQGALTYAVLIDGQLYGTSNTTKLTPVQPVPDGQHTWRVIATDARGQTTATPVRTLRVDATPPVAEFKLSGTRRAGSAVTVKVTAADGSLETPTGSGIATVKVDFGDGAVVASRTAVHRYAKRGTYTVRVSATDKAGNAIAVTRRVTIAKKKKGK